MLYWRSLVVGLIAALPMASLSWADVYVYKDQQGVLNFTNVPTHQGYRRIYNDKNSHLSGQPGSGDNYEDLIRSASDRHRIDPHLIRAVIRVESDFKSDARSNKGAMGLMQLMPDTARLHNVMDAYNPNDNVEGGVRHLRMLLDRFRGDLGLTLAAYNAGIGAVEKYRGIPPFLETKDYVRRVLHHYDVYRANGLQVLRQISR
jgi:soluble lytic murein transglycosylase-like protein